MKQAPFYILLIMTGLLTIGVSASARPGKKLPALPYSDSSMSQVPRMEEILSEILNISGIEEGFVLQQANVRNLEASISHRKKMILYNPVFIDWINRSTQDKWAAIALLAHEIGHHIKGHTSGKRGARQTFELEADEFAGSILRQMGASLQQSQEVMYYIAKPEASKFYPSQAARMQAIRLGWEK